MQSTGGSIALFLTGLFFFSLGLEWVTGAFKGMASKTMRERMRFLAGSPVRASALGFAFGGLTQSAVAVAMTFAGAVSGGVLSLRCAMAAVAWANVGTVILVLFASFDLNAATLWLIGIAGLLWKQKRLDRFQWAFSLLVGVGMVLFGLSRVREATDPESAAQWIGGVAGLLRDYPAMALVIGALLRSLMQSTGGSTIVLITLSSKGLIGLEVVMIALAGIGIGAGVSILVLCRGMRGDALRLVFVQALLNLLGGLLMFVWFVAGNRLGVPTVLDLLSGLHLDLPRLMAGAFVFQMLMCPALYLPFSGALLRLAQRLVPDVQEDNYARPAFLSALGSRQADLALGEARQEQLRLLKALPLLLQTIRLDGAGGESLNPKSLAESLLRLNGEIVDHVTQAMDRTEDADLKHQQVELLHRQRLVRELLSNLRKLVASGGDLPQGSESRAFVGRLAESMDLLLHALLTFLKQGDELDAQMLDNLTQDRGAQMERLRIDVAQGNFGTADQRSTVLYLSSLYERTVYLIRRFVRA
ncbi:MAG: hypothetical protein RI897_4528 [Verrucomicrobiota bacterium]